MPDRVQRGDYLEGVIRFKNVRGKALDEAINALIEGARQATKGSGGASTPSEETRVDR